MKLSDFSDDELKSIIMDGVVKYRNSIHPNSMFNHESISVGFEIITYTLDNPTKEESKRTVRCYRSRCVCKEKEILRCREKNAWLSID